jgi:putative addiction module killer protein
LEQRDPSAHGRILARLFRVSQGNLGDVEAVGGNVSALRIHYGPGYRVYLTRRGREIVFLLCGGDKSTQRRDIKRAKELAEEV